MATSISKRQEVLAFIAVTRDINHNRYPFPIFGNVTYADNREEGRIRNAVHVYVCMLVSHMTRSKFANRTISIHQQR